MADATLRVTDARHWSLRLGLLAVIGFLLFLPGLASLPITDRDEARYVQSSRQMVESGDLIDIRFQDKPRLKKPVGIYWAQSLAAVASGKGAEAPLAIWRLPSLFAAVAAVVLVAVAGRPLIGAGPAGMAALLFAATLVLAGEARIAKTDATVLALMLVGQAALARLWMAERPALVARGWIWAFWLSIGFGLLVKGPIGPMVAFLTLLCLGLLGRDMAWARPLWRAGPIMAAALVFLPWLVAITIVSDGAFWRDSVMTDMGAKMASGQEGKGAPPGTYIVLMWLTYWPGAVLLPLAFAAIWARLRGLWRVARGGPFPATGMAGTPEPALGPGPGLRASAFLLAWVLPGWLIYEAVPTKLVHYTMIFLPGLALLSVAVVIGGLAGTGRLARGLATVALLPGLGLALALLLLAQDKGGGPDVTVPLALGLGFATVFALIAAQALWQARASRLILALFLAGGSVSAGMFSGLANLDWLWPSSVLRAEVDRLAVARGCLPGQVRLVSLGYNEPSIVWLFGRDTPIMEGAAAPPPASLAENCRFWLRRAPKTSAEAPPFQGLQRVADVQGFALGAGRKVTLQVFASALGEKAQ